MLPGAARLSERAEKLAKAETEVLFRYVRRMTFNVGGIWESEGGKDETRRALTVAEAGGGKVSKASSDSSESALSSAVADYTSSR